MNSSSVIVVLVNIMKGWEKMEVGSQKYEARSLKSETGRGE